MHMVMPSWLEELKKPFIYLAIAVSVAFVIRFLDTVAGPPPPRQNPLDVVIPSRTIYAAALVANDGLRANSKSLFWEKKKVSVRFSLNDSPDECAGLLKDEKHIVWSTIDSLPFLLEECPSARAFMMVGRRNPDGIVTRAAMTSPRGLPGPIAMVARSPSRWVYEILCDPRRLYHEPQNPPHVFLDIPLNTPTEAYRTFRSKGDVNAAVLWGPELIQARLLAEKTQNYRVFSYESHAQGDRVVDVLVADRRLLNERGGDIKKLVGVWLEEARTALSSVSAADAANVLIGHARYTEPAWDADISKEEWHRAVSESVKEAQQGTASQDDNKALFGSGESEETEFTKLYNDATETWRHWKYFKRDPPPSAACASYPTVVWELGDKPPSRPSPCARGVPGTRLAVYFKHELQVELDEEATRKLDEWVISVKCFFEPATRFCVEGHTDIKKADNKAISQWRAEAVIRYLEHKYPKFFNNQFEQPLAYADAKAAPGDREEVHLSNRRAEVFVEQK